MLEIKFAVEELVNYYKQRNGRKISTARGNDNVRAPPFECCCCNVRGKAFISPVLTSKARQENELFSNLQCVR